MRGARIMVFFGVRMTTSAERQHMAKVAAIGCIVCDRLGYPDTPCELHHIRDGQGMGKRASHKEVIPLCHRHHRTGGHGVAIHAGRETWEAQFGTERELLAIVLERI